MYRFPEGVFSDVRLEESVTTVIAFVMGRLEQRRERTERTAFIRVFDGIRWYFSSLTDPRQSTVQEKLDDLAAMASAGGIEGHPVLDRLSRQQGREHLGPPGRNRWVRRPRFSSRTSAS